MGREPRLLADQDDVRVLELESEPADTLGGEPKQVERGGAAPARIAGREHRADVVEPRCAQDRVDERVREHVAVGVAGKAPRRLDRHASEDERDPVRKGVRVDADADAKLGHPSGSGRLRRSSKTVTAS